MPLAICTQVFWVRYASPSTIQPGEAKQTTEQRGYAKTTARYSRNTVSRYWKMHALSFIISDYKYSVIPLIHHNVARQKNLTINKIQLECRR